MFLLKEAIQKKGYKRPQPMTLCYYLLYNDQSQGKSNGGKGKREREREKAHQK
jgi:hypothetical protein